MAGLRQVFDVPNADSCIWLGDNSSAYFCSSLLDPWIPKGRKELTRRESVEAGEERRGLECLQNQFATGSFSDAFFSDVSFLNPGSGKKRMEGKKRVQVVTFSSKNLCG